MGNAIVKSVFGVLLAVVLLATGATARAGLQEARKAYADKDYKTLLQELKPLVNQGVAEASFYVGLLYDNGEGVQQSYQNAMDWYTKAAKQGYAPAQNNLGVIYQIGTSVELSDKAAEFWYRKAAEQGYAPAQFNLGFMYFIGNKIILRDHKEAASWYRKAAEQGYAPAQNSLGQMYENALGLDVSLIQADKWYSLSARAGDEAAQQNKNTVEAKMPPDMIEEAQALVRDWLAKHP